MKKQIETKIMNPMIGKDFPLPEYATDGSAGLDIRACIEEPIVLQPGQTRMIGSGFGININDPKLVAVLVARSGLGIKHGIVIAQGAGIIDSDYHGEIFAALWNRSEEAFTISPGERICQMLFMPVVQASLFAVTDFSTTTERGTGGFGSTGRD